MTSTDIVIERLTATAIAPYGDVTEVGGPPTTIDRGQGSVSGDSLT